MSPLCDSAAVKRWVVTNHRRLSGLPRWLQGKEPFLLPVRCLMAGWVLANMVLWTFAPLVPAYGNPPDWVVEPGEEARALGFPSHGKRDDVIRSRLRYRIWEDPVLAGAHIQVEVLHGRVILRGTVLDEDQARYALMLVKSHPDVRRVESHLVVIGPRAVPDEPRHRRPADADIASRIRTGLRDARLDEGNTINLNIYHGVVILDGRVRSWQEYTRILELIHRTDGVEKVIDRMQVAE